MNFDVSRILKGFFAGLAGTVVLTGLMLVKKTMGVMPALDPVHMLSTMAADKMGMVPNPAIGWVMHFMIGAVAWGGGFAVLNGLIPGRSQVAKGVLFGIAAWLLMMIGPMPMSGAGLFALNIGPMAPMMTFVFHIVFGVVLGAVFLKLNGPDNA